MAHPTKGSRYSKNWRHGMLEEWLHAGVPPARAEALSSLHFRRAGSRSVDRLDDAGWAKLLEYCDRSGLTLFVADRLAAVLPAWVKERTGIARLRNRERVRGLCDLHRVVQACLEDAGIPFAVLKGFTHRALSGLDPICRQQYDIDILTSPDDAPRAAAALAALGFEPFSAMAGFPADHLPALIRRTGWEFRGDYFDPEIPVSLEIHFQLWDGRTTRLQARGTDAFWPRRTIRDSEAGPLPALTAADSLGFAGLHVLKHLLQGSVRAFHVYELAAMLDRQCNDAALWDAWKETHDGTLRRLEAVGFRLAERWFGCILPDIVETEWRMLPGTARAWFDAFGLAPAAPATKSEVWLHCALLESRRDRFAVLRRRLLPSRLPPPVDGVYLGPRQLNWRRKALCAARQARYVAGRFMHHALAAIRLAGSGARWWLRARATHS